jgi:hypothetical protein
MSSMKKQYGVFSGELNKHAGTAIAMGVFIGSSWAVAAVIACGIAMLVGGAATADIRWILSIVLGMLAGGILQQLWFNFRPALRIAYGRRIAGFGITYFLILALCALLGSWLPEGIPEAWAGFAGLYLLILSILTLAFSFAFRKRSEEYQDLLDRFHKESGR